MTEMSTNNIDHSLFSGTLRWASHGLFRRYWTLTSDGEVVAQLNVRALRTRKTAVGTWGTMGWSLDFRRPWFRQHYVFRSAETGEVLAEYRQCDGVTLASSTGETMHLVFGRGTATPSEIQDASGNTLVGYPVHRDGETKGRPVAEALGFDLRPGTYSPDLFVSPGFGQRPDAPWLTILLLVMSQIIGAGGSP